MSVYTPLSLEEVQAFAEPYGLAIIDLIPIQGGIQNTNYFLVDQSQKHYVLTVFEELDAEEQVNWYLYWTVWVRQAYLWRCP